VLEKVVRLSSLVILLKKIGLWPLVIAFAFFYVIPLGLMVTHTKHLQIWFGFEEEHLKED